MPDGYKVKLPDGKVYGPMASDLVRRWYEDGRITKDSPVLRPGSARWTSLAQAVDLRAWSAKGATPLTRRAPADKESLGAGVRVAGMLFLFGAALSVLRAFAPASWLPDLTGVPWIPVAGVQLLLGLGLLLASRVARTIVLVLMALAVLGYLSLGGFLILKGIKGAPLFLAFFGLASLMGYYALLLGTEHSRARIATGAAIALLGGLAAFAAEMAPALNARREMEKWSSSDRRFSDQELGVTLDLPPGWVILKSDNPMIKTPPNSRLFLAQPNLVAFAFLVVDRRPHGIASLDHYLDRFFQQLKKTAPDVKELNRTETRVGSMPARTATLTFDAESLAFQARVTVWQDGWNYFALLGGGVNHLAKKVNPELDALLKGFTVYGVLSTRLEQALLRITTEAPHLSRISASMLMVDAAGRELQPAEAFRMGFSLATKGLPFLPPDEAREMLAINERLYASVSAKDRARLGAYFERLRAGQATSAEEDQQMCQLVKTAVLRLPGDTQHRLQEIYEKMLAPVVMRESPVVVGN